MSYLYQFTGLVLFKIYEIIQNYGVSIIIFTVFIKVLLLPLNIKQTKSMKETQALQPELKKLQEKYKNNPEKLNQETMKLYKIYKVNPASGCLPLLVQLPIMFALFEVLRNPIKWVFPEAMAGVASTGFMWLADLGAPDKLYILPVLCAVTTFLSTKFTMTAQKGTADKTTESTQKMMLYMMPLIIGYSALRFPAGVALYWVVQNIFTFIQQFIMMLKPYEPVSAREAEEKLEEAKRLEHKKRKEVTEARQEAMGAAPKNKKSSDTVKIPKMKPASGKKVTNRKTVTKIPERQAKPDSSKENGNA